MTPSKRIDRVFAGVGRLALSSGTDHRPTFKRINAMLTGLHKTGRLDLLAWIRDGHIRPLEVLHFYERGQLDRIPHPEQGAGLVEAFRSFVAAHDVADSTREDMEGSTRKLEAVARKGAPVSELPALLRGLRDTMKPAPIAFNRLRAHCLAFANATHGKHSALWVEVARVNRFKKAEGRRPRTLLRRPLTVAELDSVCAAFVDVPVFGGRRGGGKTLRRTITAASLADTARTLGLSGMRPQEYWQRDRATWSDQGTYVKVNGTKTTAADRVTLRLVPPAVPACGEQVFRREFAKATTKALRAGLDAYSLRRTFAALCEGARLVESRKDAYMGHGPKTVSALYLKTNVLPFVQEDGDLVAQFIRAERERAAAPTLKLEKGS